MADADQTGSDWGHSQPWSLILFTLGKSQLPGSKWGRRRNEGVKSLIKKGSKAFLGHQRALSKLDFDELYVNEWGTCGSHFLPNTQGFWNQEVRPWTLKRKMWKLGKHQTFAKPTWRLRQHPTSLSLWAFHVQQLTVNVGEHKNDCEVKPDKHCGDHGFLCWCWGTQELSVTKCSPSVRAFVDCWESCSRIHNFFYISKTPLMGMLIGNDYAKVKNGHGLWAPTICGSPDLYPGVWTLPKAGHPHSWPELWLMLCNLASSFFF